MTARSFEYRHVIGFEETNLVGNVYYVNHVRWQGRVRELFLREHAPEVLAELSRDLALATVRVSCEYFTELSAFDEIVIRMRLGQLVQNRITMRYDYVRISRGSEEQVARGEQEIACMRRVPHGLVATAIPEALLRALGPFGLLSPPL